MRQAKILLSATCLKGPFHPSRPVRRGDDRRSARWPGVPALVRPHPRDRRRAIVSFEGRAVEVAIGRAGIRTLKREGDGGTPRCRLRPVAVVTRERAVLPVASRRVRETDGWCDQPESAAYNRACRVPTRFGHETLVREDGLYHFMAVTDHNQIPRVRGAGSAIFLHVAAPGLTPTAGCIAFPLSAWRRARVPLGPYLVGVDPRPVR